MNCIFCSIVEKNDPHHEIVWSDDAHIAFLNKYPTNTGHMLVIPRGHTDYAFDLTPSEFGDLLEASRRLAVPFRAATGATRIALALDGFQIPHVHVHLVPVHKSGDLARPERPVSAEELKQTADSLRMAFADII